MSRSRRRGVRARRPRVDEAVDAEIAHHIEERRDALIRQGLDPSAADREARRVFGNVERTRVTLMRIGKVARAAAAMRRGVELISRDARHATRSLRRAPGFSLAVVLTLALCIGVNAAVLSTLYDLVIAPVPASEPERTVKLFNLRERRSANNAHSESSWSQYVDLRERTAMFDGAALLTPLTKLVAYDGTVQRLEGQAATSELFDIMGASPVVGRFFRPDEVDPGPGRVIVLSQSFWESRFAADSGVIGRDVVLDDGVPHTIIGVAPRRLEALDYAARFTVPYPVQARERDPARGRYQAHSHDLWLRLRPGVTRDVARQRIRDIEREWFDRVADAEGRRVFQDYDARVAFDLPHPLGRSLYLVQGGSLLVLLAGCFNVVTLFAIRGRRRGRELAIRRAMGAGGVALRRLVLVESLGLASVAAATGLALAWGGTLGINRYLAALSPHTMPIAVHAAGVIGTVAVSVAVAGVCGLLSVEVGRRGRPEALRGSRAATLHGIAIAAQAAVGFIMLIGAGLLFTSFHNVVSVEPGFAAGQVVEGRLDFSTVQTFYPSRRDAGALERRIVDAVADIAGVESVALSMFPMFSRDLRAGGRNFMSGAAAATPPPAAHIVSPGFFRTMGIPILSGRACAAADDMRVVVVDALFAERYFDGMDPVGLEMPRDEPGIPPARIIGVSGRAHLRGREQRDIQPFAYYCEPIERGWWEYSILLRTDRPATDAVHDLERTLRRIDPRLPLSYTHSLREALDEMVVARRGLTMLLGSYSALAVALAVMGVHTVVAMAVAQRRREIGIRVALGARPRAIYRLVLGNGLGALVIGIGIGFAGAVALSGALERFVFDVNTLDPATFAIAAAVFIAATAMACLGPARRATAIDPAATLRDAL